MYYIYYENDTGKILDVYPYTEEAPSPNITITDEEFEQFLDGKYYIVRDGKLVEAERPTQTIDPVYEDTGSTQDTQAEYEAVFSNLRDAYVCASILGDDMLKSTLRNEYRDRLAEFRLNNSLVHEPASYCKICGSALTEDKCAKCGWSKT